MSDFTNAPFPSPTSAFIGNGGMINPQWNRLLVSIWGRTGGATGKNGFFAYVNGSVEQVFNVAPAVTDTQAVPKAQAIALSDTEIRTLSGSASSVVAIPSSPHSYTATENGSMSIGGNGVYSVKITRGSTVIPVARYYGVIPMRKDDVLTISFIGSPVLNWLPD